MTRPGRCISTTPFYLGLFAVLLLVGGCTTGGSSLNGNFKSAEHHMFNVPALQAHYQRINQHDAPVVSYMDWGHPRVLIYADGTVITKAVPERRGTSGLMVARLPVNDLASILANIGLMDGFWALSNKYTLSHWSEQSSHRVCVQIENRPEKTVSVYGSLENPRPGDMAVPPDFRAFITRLLKIRPKSSIPWDPGYVELGFADYSYAPEASSPWPSTWPALTGPLVRDVKGWVISKVMIFPSQASPQLDEFLNRRAEGGAILIGGWKTTANYRWPLPGEKTWTSWDQ